jgi:hypothetical protein
MGKSQIKTLSEILGTEKLEQIIKFFDYLHNRWQDEKNYEKIEEYCSAFEKKLGYKITGFSKNPFQVCFMIDATKYFFKVSKGRIVYGYFIHQKEEAKMLESRTFTLQDKNGMTMLVEETIYPSMCAEFDPNGAFTIGYQFFLLCTQNLWIVKMSKQDVKEFYKNMNSRKDRISLYYIIKEQFEGWREK